MWNRMHETWRVCGRRACQRVSVALNSFKVGTGSCKIIPDPSTLLLDWRAQCIVDYSIGVERRYDEKPTLTFPKHRTLLLSRFKGSCKKKGNGDMREWGRYSQSYVELMNHWNVGKLGSEFRSYADRFILINGLYSVSFFFALKHVLCLYPSTVAKQCSIVAHITVCNSGCHIGVVGIGFKPRHPSQPITFPPKLTTSPSAIAWWPDQFRRHCISSIILGFKCAFASLLSILWH